MFSLAYLFDIIKYFIAGTGVVMVAMYIIKPYIHRAEKLQLLELKKATANQTLPLRLQAYERLVLFIERINPANLLVRINAPAFNRDELLNLVMTEIRTEYQHNITQQVYVSTEAWALVRRIKDDTITLINNIVRSLPAEASGLEASKIILTHLTQLEDNPYEAALTEIKKDLEQLF